jgi:uncharacterized membrane protein YhhN
LVWALAGIGVLLAALAVTAALLPGTPWGLARRTWILTASTSFVGLGVLSAATVRRRSSVFLLAGLVHCWLGDALGPVNFTLGGLSFLCGHLWFAAAFAGQGLDRTRSRRAGAALLASGVLIGGWLLPRVDSTLNLVLVLAYMAVISWMVAAAAGTRGGPWRYAVLAAGMFYVSDIVVADWRFIHSAFRHDLLCYPLYYGSCVLLALWPLRMRWAAGEVNQGGEHGR